MTQMSNPYAALQRDELLIERKVSVLAIVALVVTVLGVLACIVPGLAGLGAMLGVAALVVISQSDGRVGGRGLAITAIVLGLLITIAQVGVVIGANRVMSQANTAFIGPMQALVAQAEQKDLAKVRSHLTDAAAQRLTQEHLDAFANGVSAELGALDQKPLSMVELISWYGKLGPLMQRFQGAVDVIPVPVKFEKGVALLAVQVDNRGVRPPPGAVLNVPIINAKIYTLDGKSWTLFPGDASPEERFPPPPPRPSDASPQSDPPPSNESGAPAGQEPA